MTCSRYRVDRRCSAGKYLRDSVHIGGLELTLRVTSERLAKLTADIGRTGVIALALVLLSYSPNLFLRFAFADDYAYLAIHGYRAVNPFFLADGRPLGGFLAVFLFTVFDRISYDAVLRFLALAQIMLALFLIQRAAVRAGLEAKWAALLSVAFVASPAVQNWVPWGVAAWQMPALLCALVSLEYWRRLIDEQGCLSAFSALAFGVLSFVGMLIYQPFATAVWPLILLETIVGPRDRILYRRVVLGLLLYATVLVLYFLFYKFFLITFVPPDGPHGRTSVIGIDAVPTRLAWFFSGPVYSSFSLFFTHGKAWVAAATVTLGIVGIWRFSGGRFATMTLLLLFALAVTFLSHAPSLAAPEPTGVRTQVTLALTAVCIVVPGLAALTDIVGWKGFWTNAFALTACAGISLWAGLTVMKVTAWPQALELALIERELEKTPLPVDRPILLVGLPYGVSLAGRLCDDVANMGCVSSSMQFALPNMVRLWMRDRRIDFTRYKLLFVSSEASKTAISFEPNRTTRVPIPENAYFLNLGAVVTNAARP